MKSLLSKGRKKYLGNIFLCSFLLRKQGRPDAPTCSTTITIFRILPISPMFNGRKRCHEPFMSFYARCIISEFNTMQTTTSMLSFQLNQVSTDPCVMCLLFSVNKACKCKQISVFPIETCLHGLFKKNTLIRMQHCKWQKKGVKK
jgi:hypothetical protein